MAYIQGLHIIAEFKSEAVQKLIDLIDFKCFVGQLVTDYNLQEVGSVFHSFGEHSGFTSVICLTESHLSVHTWPEYGILTLDVYLSNNHQNNYSKVESIYADLKVYFDAKEVNETRLLR